MEPHNQSHLDPASPSGPTTRVLVMCVLVGWIAAAPFLYSLGVYALVGMANVGYGDYISRAVPQIIFAFCIFLLPVGFFTWFAFKKRSATIAVCAPVMSLVLVLLASYVFQLVRYTYLDLKPVSNVFPTETRFVCSKEWYIDVHSSRVDLINRQGARGVYFILGTIEDGKLVGTSVKEKYQGYISTCRNSAGKTVEELYLN